jgi:hypothetical protein
VAGVLVEEGLLGPEVVAHDCLLYVFTWAALVPGPVVWRAHYFPQGEGAELEQPPDLEREVGVWGETCLVPLTDRTGRLVVRFLTNGPTVGLLEVALRANRASVRFGGPANHGPLDVIDLNGPGRAVHLGDAALEGPPRKLTLGGNVPVHEYVFLGDQVESFFAPVLV